MRARHAAWLGLAAIVLAAASPFHIGWARRHAGEIAEAWRQQRVARLHERVRDLVGPLIQLAERVARLPDAKAALRGDVEARSRLFLQLGEKTSSIGGDYPASIGLASVPASEPSAIASVGTGTPPAVHPIRNRVERSCGDTSDGRRIRISNLDEERRITERRSRPRRHTRLQHSQDSRPR